MFFLLLVPCLAAFSFSARPASSGSDTIRSLRQHAQRRAWREALDVLSKEESPTAVHFNIAMHACGRAGKWRKALALLDEMDGMADAYSFSTAISALGEASSRPRSRGGGLLLPTAGLTLAQSLLSRMERADLPPSTVAYNAAIKLAGQASDAQAAVDLLAAMRAGGFAETRSWNAALHALAKAGDWGAALSLLAEAEAGGLADVVTYTAAISACTGRSDEAQRIMNRMRRCGLQPNEYSYSALISAYVPEGRWVEALGMLDEMQAVGVPPGVVAFTAAISACAAAGQARQALRLLLLRMPRAGVAPTVWSWNAAMKACAKAPMVEWRRDNLLS